MGISQVAQAPATKKWKRVTSAMLERNASSVINTAMTIALPLVPEGYVSVPASYAISEGLRFANDVRKRGLERAAKRAGIRLAERFVAAGVSNMLWHLVASRVDNELINSPFGRLAEGAFKKTVTAIVREGANALEE